MLIDKNTDINSMLKTLSPKVVKIVGGYNTIPKSVEDTIKKHNIKVERYSGSNRYETNKMTLRNKGEEVIAVSGEKYADAISATNLMKYKYLPIKLVKKDQKSIGKTGVYTIGGKSSVENTFGTRIHGVNRFDTNRKIINKLAINNSKRLKIESNSFNEPLMATNILFNEHGSVIELVPDSKATKAYNLDNIETKFAKRTKKISVANNESTNNYAASNEREQKDVIVANGADEIKKIIINKVVFEGKIPIQIKASQSVWGEYNSDEKIDRFVEDMGFRLTYRNTDYNTKEIGLTYKYSR